MRPFPNFGLSAPSVRPVPAQRIVRRLNIDGDDQGDLIWKTDKFERLWIAIGPPPMRTTSRGSTTFTVRTRCSNILNRASASAGGVEIQSSRAAQPNRKRFTVRRIIGAGDLWVSEFVLTYDGRPSYTLSIMEFLDGKVARETQYFGDPFEPGPSRAQWVERMA